MDIVEDLKEAGFKVVEGKHATIQAISDCADSVGKLCSGHGVFPDGSKCNGCPDCRKPVERFEVGKYYKHSGGGVIHIVGAVKTTTYGWTLVAEEHCSSQLKLVGQGVGYAENWSETTVEHWLSGFSK